MLQEIALLYKVPTRFFIKQCFQLLKKGCCVNLRIEISVRAEKTLKVTAVTYDYPQTRIPTEFKVTNKSAKLGLNPLSTLPKLFRAKF